VTTSEGIILIDSGYDYSIKELSDGLKKFGLDPAQIKYVVLSHAHGDRYFGAKFLQDTYRARIVLSEADWTVMAKSNEPEELKAKHTKIGDARHIGLFAALEFVKDRKTKEPADLTPLKGFLMERGLYVFNFKNILFVVPPLIISREELESGLTLLDEGIAELMA
jgi:glyoxylase-like metal-dependent hydrolase (beta-lactamase superfamily II)